MGPCIFIGLLPSSQICRSTRATLPGNAAAVKAGAAAALIETLEGNNSNAVVVVEVCGALAYVATSEAGDWPTPKGLKVLSMRIPTK